MNATLMNLSELKRKPATELAEMAAALEVEGGGRLRKQDLIFAILKAQAKKGEDIIGEGVVEILQDGFGFLRSADASYLAGPDDIYVSPSQIRRFNLRTGDTVKGNIRPPKESERYFALLKVDEINFQNPDEAKNKVLFENLTPLHPTERFGLERDNASTENLTARVIESSRITTSFLCSTRRLAFSITISATCTWRLAGSSNVEEITSPRTERCISVTSSGRSSMSSTMRKQSGWLAVIACAMFCSMTVLPVRGGATMRPRVPLPIGVKRSIRRVVCSSGSCSSRSCSLG